MAEDQFDGFLWVEGVQGECQAEGYLHWIDVDSFSFSATSEFTPSKGVLVGRNPSPGHFEFKEPMHSGTIALYRLCLTGMTVKEVKFHVRKAGGAKFLTYFEAVMKGCVVTSVSIDASGKYPEETVQIQYTSIELKYREQHTALGTQHKGDIVGSYTRAKHMMEEEEANA
jgi:type VI protein secretion system component Hcp